MEKNYEVQELRAVGMILILLGHMPLILSKYIIHSYPFVSTFLMLTGFFSMKSLMNKYNDDTNSRSIIFKELVNRAFRLFPLMYIWILLYFMIGWITIFSGGQYGDWRRWKNELSAVLNCTYNYYLARLNIGGLFGQFWTLFVEIHFAIFFIITFSLIRKKKLRIWFSIAMVLFTIFIFRPLTKSSMVRYATHAQLDSLYVGALIALIFDDKKRYLNKLSKKLGYNKYIITIIIMMLLLLSGWYFDTYLNNMNIKYFAYTFVSAILIFLARENDGWFDFKIGWINKVLIIFGDTSASIYVSHVIIYSCIYYYIYHNTTIIPELIKNTWYGITLQAILLVIVAFIVGRISYYLIEMPYNLLAKKIVRSIR